MPLSSVTLRLIFSSDLVSKSKIASVSKLLPETLNKLLSASFTPSAACNTKRCVSPASGSIADSTAATVLAGIFSSISVLERIISVAGMFSTISFTIIVNDIVHVSPAASSA